MPKEKIMVKKSKKELFNERLTAPFGFLLFVFVCGGIYSFYKEIKSSFDMSSFGLLSNFDLICFSLMFAIFSFVIMYFIMYFLVWFMQDKYKEKKKEKKK